MPDDPELPLGAQLAQLMATHEFQEAFKNYRDLLFLDRNLQQWQESLGVLRDMLTNRREAFAARLPQVREKELALNLAGADERYQALRAELEQVERNADPAAFATPRERELKVRLDRVRETLERAGSDPEFAQARERYRRAAGALLWQQSDQFAVRLWNAKKGMQELQRNLSEAQQRDAALAVAERDEPARLDAFGRAHRCAGGARGCHGSARDRLAREQGNAVQELAVAELLHQKERLAAYGTQARFAVAQIYDRASTAREDGRAATQ